MVQFMLFKMQKIEIGIRPVGTFYVKCTLVSHTQALADVWREIPISQTSNNVISSFIGKIVKGTILSSIDVNTVIFNGVSKDTNSILSMSGVVQC